MHTHRAAVEVEVEAKAAAIEAEATTITILIHQLESTNRRTNNITYYRKCIFGLKSLPFCLCTSLTLILI